MGLKLFIRILQIFAQNVYEVKIDGNTSIQFTKLSPLSSTFDKDFADIIRNCTKNKFERITIEYIQNNNKTISLALDMLNPNTVEISDEKSLKYLLPYSLKNNRYVIDDQNSPVSNRENSVILNAISPYIDNVKIYGLENNLTSEYIFQSLIGAIWQDSYGREILTTIYKLLPKRSEYKQRQIYRMLYYTYHTLCDMYKHNIGMLTEKGNKATDECKHFTENMTSYFNTVDIPNSDLNHRLFTQQYMGTCFGLYKSFGSYRRGEDFVSESDFVKNTLDSTELFLTEELHRVLPNDSDNNFHSEVLNVFNNLASISERTSAPIYIFKPSIPTPLIKNVSKNKLIIYFICDKAEKWLGTVCIFKFDNGSKHEEVISHSLDSHLNLYFLIISALDSLTGVMCSNHFEIIKNEYNFSLIEIYIDASDTILYDTKDKSILCYRDDYHISEEAINHKHREIMSLYKSLLDRIDFYHYSQMNKTALENINKIVINYDTPNIINNSNNKDNSQINYLSDSNVREVPTLPEKIDTVYIFKQSDPKPQIGRIRKNTLIMYFSCENDYKLLKSVCNFKFKECKKGRKIINIPFEFYADLTHIIKYSLDNIAKSISNNTISSYDDLLAYNFDRIKIYISKSNSIWYDVHNKTATFCEGKYFMSSKALNAEDLKTISIYKTALDKSMENHIKNYIKEKEKRKEEKRKERVRSQIEKNTNLGTFQPAYSKQYYISDIAHDLCKCKIFEFVSEDLSSYSAIITVKCVQCHKEMNCLKEYFDKHFKQHGSQCADIKNVDVIILSDSHYCFSHGHKVIDVIGTITMRKNTKISQEIVPLFYCRNCNKYTMLKVDYLSLKEKGIPICVVKDTSGKIISDPNTYDFEDSNLNTESYLHKLGYNVRSDNGLSAFDRQQILYDAIASHKLTRSEICSHLQWLIKYNQNKSNFQSAISKWKADLNYVKNLRISFGNDVNIVSLKGKLR